MGLILAAVLRAGNRVSEPVPYAARVSAPGERIESTQLDGNRILLRLSGAKGEELVVLDAASGRVLGRIGIDSGP